MINLKNVGELFVILGWTPRYGQLGERMPEGEPVEELHGDIGRTETSEEDIAGELILRTKNTMQVIK